MGLRPISKLTNGSAKRKLESWIGQFVQYTDNIESPEIFRKWSAISTIAAVLQRKVYMRTQSALYPNLYVFLVARAGVGKTRAIYAADEFVRKIEGIVHGHTSMTMASLVDRLSEAKCRIQRLAKGEGMLEYNSLYVVADELSAFMSEYESGLIAGLTT